MIMTLNIRPEIDTVFLSTLNKWIAAYRHKVWFRRGMDDATSIDRDFGGYNYLELMQLRDRTEKAESIALDNLQRFTNSQFLRQLSLSGDPDLIVNQIARSAAHAERDRIKAEPVLPQEYS